MRLSVDVLNGSCEDALAAIPSAASQQSLWTSDWFLQALQRTLTKAQSEHLLVSHGGAPVAVVPAFRTDAGPGTVVNSLPFFGSHGGIHFDPAIGIDGRASLLATLEGFWRDTGVDRVVLIEPLLRPDLTSSCPRAHLVATRSSRISPISGIEGGSTTDRVVEAMHSKQRNAYRKGVTSLRGLSVVKSTTPEDVLSIWQEHELACRGQSRRYKPLGFFEEFMCRWEDPGNPIRVFVAKTSTGQLAAGLILFQVGGVVEYFTPVVTSDWRPKQVLSALIVHAMSELGSQGGAGWWNWGGTWGTQDSLARFKQRWGGTNVRYGYWEWDIGKCRDLDEAPRDLIESTYPFFFVRPFEERP